MYVSFRFFLLGCLKKVLTIKTCNTHSYLENSSSIIFEYTFKFNYQSQTDQLLYSIILQQYEQDMNEKNVDLKRLTTIFQNTQMDLKLIDKIFRLCLVSMRQEMHKSCFVKITSLPFLKHDNLTKLILINIQPFAKRH